jgi:hypothetical protein
MSLVRGRARSRISRGPALALAASMLWGIALCASVGQARHPAPLVRALSVPGSIETRTVALQSTSSLPASPALSSGRSSTDFASDAEGATGRLSRRALRTAIVAAAVGPGHVDLSHARAAALSRLAFATELTRASAGELAGRSTAPPVPSA